MKDYCWKIRISFDHTHGEKHFVFHPLSCQVNASKRHSAHDLLPTMLFLAMFADGLFEETLLVQQLKNRGLHLPLIAQENHEPSRVDKPTYTQGLTHVLYGIHYW